MRTHRKAQPIVSKKHEYHGNSMKPTLSVPDLDVDSKGYFTPTELEIAARLADGKRQLEIAKERFVSLQTVKTHVRSLRWKTRMHTSAGVVAFLLRKGIIK